jgi:hypothetical protein
MQSKMEEQQHRLNREFSEGVEKLAVVFRDIGYSEQEKTAVFSVSSLRPECRRWCCRLDEQRAAFRTVLF